MRYCIINLLSCATLLNLSSLVTLYPFPMIPSRVMSWKSRLPGGEDEVLLDSRRGSAFGFTEG